MNHVSTVGIIDQILDHIVDVFAVEHAVEQFDVTFFIAEEMIELEPAKVAVLERRQHLQEDHRIASRCRRTK